MQEDELFNCPPVCAVLMNGCIIARTEHELSDRI